MYSKIKNFCRAPKMWIKHVDQNVDQTDPKMWIKHVIRITKCGSFKNVDLSQIESMGGSHAAGYTGHANLEEAHDLMHHFVFFLIFD